MTTPHIDDDQLQRYFDGELPEDETERVRQAVEASEEGRAQLERLERLRGLLRISMTDAAQEVASEPLYARVQREVVADRRRAGIRAIEGGRGTKAAVAGGLALALAAAVTLAVLQPWGAQQPDAPVAEAPPQEVPAAVAEAEPQGLGQQGSEVVEVDFGHNTGTVFEVQGGAGQPLAVVWINDEENLP